MTARTGHYWALEPCVFHPLMEHRRRVPNGRRWHLPHNICQTDARTGRCTKNTRVTAASHAHSRSVQSADYFENREVGVSLACSDTSLIIIIDKMAYMNIQYAYLYHKEAYAYLFNFTFYAGRCLINTHFIDVTRFRLFNFSSTFGSVSTIQAL